MMRRGISVLVQPRFILLALALSVLLLFAFAFSRQVRDLLFGCARVCLCVDLTAKLGFCSYSDLVVIVWC